LPTPPPGSVPAVSQAATTTGAARAEPAPLVRLDGSTASACSVEQAVGTADAVRASRAGGSVGGRRARCAPGLGPPVRLFPDGGGSRRAASSGHGRLLRGRALRLLG